MKRLITLLALIGAVVPAGCSESIPTSATTQPTAASTSLPTAAPIATSTPTAAPSSTPEPTSLFVLDTDHPVLRHGKFGNTTYSGPVVEHEGTFYLFYVVFGAAPTDPEQIGYATSTDGREWTPASDTPLLSGTDVTYLPANKISVAGVVVEDNGTWVMYVDVWEPIRNGRSAILRAEAPDPEGPWTIGPDPVLEPGESGAWDGTQVFAASVLRTEDGYLMAYSGSSDGKPDSIGIAQSEDGITWTKQTDPVLVPEADWEAQGISSPSIIRTQGGYMMLYFSIQPSGERAFGLARSADGLTWERHPRNPVFTPTDAPPNLFVHSSTLLCPGDQCWLLIELVVNSSHSDLWLADAEGDLWP